MSSINFDNPWLLFIALPLIVLIIVPFAITIRKDNLNGHNLSSGIIHIVMAIIIAFAAAGTSVITTVTQTDVYVLADVSYSASLNLDTVDECINNLELPPNSRKGVICFANGHKIVTRLGERFTTVKNSGVDDSSTNIVAALNYTGSLFRDDVIKHIVLITDGKSTDGTDDDALKRQISSLAERNIHVDAIFIDNNMQGDTKEVQMSNADFNSSVSLNRDERVNLTVQANCPEGETVDATVTLYKDGEEYKETVQTFVKGENTVTFKLDTSVAGVHDYVAKVAYDDDFNANNNEISFTQSISDKTSILLIAGSIEDYYAVSELYADEIAADNVTLESRINMTEIEEITIEELCKYDQIILSDFDVSTLENSELFLDNLDMAVSLYGKSLLTFGDLKIQQKTEGELASLSNMLPVSYGKTGGASKLYTLLIDTSRSMEMGSKLDKAKTAAKEIVKLLSIGDVLNIIQFNGETSPVLINYSIQYDRTEAMERIDELKVVQGTVMSAGLELAHDRMKGGSYSEKRLILISDGIDMGGDDILGQITAMRADSINTIVMDVGRTSGDNNQTTAVQLLDDIARLGNNSAPYDISNADNIDEVINGELAQEDMGAYGGYSYISVNRIRDDVLSGINTDDVSSSYVKGFVKSQAKANANTVLNVSYSYSISGSDDSSFTEVNVPLYSYWKYGNGKVASFTSSLSGDWVSTVSAQVKDALFSNIVETCVPTEKVNYPFQFDIEKGSGSATVSITPANLRNDAWATYKITAPDGSVSQGDMSFGSLSYGYNFVTPSEGKYTVNVTYGYGNYTIEAVKYFNVAYSAEYDSFAIYDASTLIKGVGANGKVSTDGTLKIENDEKEVGVYYLSLTLPLLITCVVLYAVDIAVRKLKWEDIKSLFGRGKK
ncbi:MAG: VWA domain-containing protein [Candidatus Coproplasma sp.]